MTDVALGQCSEAMKAKLELEDSFKSISNNGDVIVLLRLIRIIVFNYKSKRYPYLIIYNSLNSFYNYHQKLSMTNDAYLEAPQNLCDVITHYRGNLTAHKFLVEHVLKEQGITSLSNDKC